MGFPALLLEMFRITIFFFRYRDRLPTVSSYVLFMLLGFRIWYYSRNCCILVDITVNPCTVSFVYIHHMYFKLENAAEFIAETSNVRFVMSQRTLEASFVTWESRSIQVGYIIH